MQPKKMSDKGSSGGRSASSGSREDDVPPFLAPPRPCLPTHSGAPPSPSEAEEKPNYNIMLYKAMKSTFKERIAVDDFMDSEEISELLTLPEMERVRRKLVNDGECEAAGLLLDILKRKHAWFDHVMKALEIPRLKQQDLRRVFLQAKEKVDKRWYASRQSDVDGATASVASTTSPTTAPSQETTALLARQLEAMTKKSATSNQRSSNTDLKHPSNQRTSNTDLKHPVRPKSEPVPDDNHPYDKVDDAASLNSTDWFHGVVSREAAEEVLEGKEPGSFLVRRSPGRDHYTLSFRSEKKIVHMVIDERPDCRGRMFYSLGEDNTTRYSTVTQLIRHYDHHPLRVAGEGRTGPGTCLSKPVSTPLRFT